MGIIIGIIFGIFIGNYLGDAATIADCSGTGEAKMRLKNISIKCSISQSLRSP